MTGVSIPTFMKNDFFHPKCRWPAESRAVHTRNHVIRRLTGRYVPRMHQVHRSITLLTHCSAEKYRRKSTPQPPRFETRSVEKSTETYSSTLSNDTLRHPSQAGLPGDNSRPRRRPLCPSNWPHHRLSAYLPPFQKKLTFLSGSGTQSNDNNDPNGSLVFTHPWFSRCKPSQATHANRHRSRYPVLLCTRSDGHAPWYFLVPRRVTTLHSLACMELGSVPRRRAVSGRRRWRTC
jgi:hypothetical protein